MELDAKLQMGGESIPFLGRTNLHFRGGIRWKKMQMEEENRLDFGDHRMWALKVGLDANRRTESIGF